MSRTVRRVTPTFRTQAVVATMAALAGCAGSATVDISPGHLDAEPVNAGAPPPVPPPPVPEPEPVEPVETYTVVVKDVPVADLLFSLARDADLDLDMQVETDKTITINATERPLPEILERVSTQARLRYSLSGDNLVVLDDKPYWYNYHVDYVNISRQSIGEVGVATQIATSGGSVGEDIGQQQDDRQGNLSKTTVKNNSMNDFWVPLEAGLVSIIAGGSADSPQQQDPVIVNPMSGVVTVYGTHREHREVQRYLDEVMANSQRQVLIEMTIVEVELSDDYQAGVDWSRVSDGGGQGSNGANFESQLLGGNLQVSPFFAIGYNDIDPDGSGITATVRMLQQFGDTKVLSSPKIMALNNQTALLKVVNERVYFTVELDIRDATADIPERRTFTSEIKTVPVGLVMSVTPQISANGYVSLNIRPTISRITGFAIDPAPRLAGADFDNLVPEIQVREIESLLTVLDGRTVVLGGLMQNERESSKDGIPGLSRIPGVGKLFAYSSDKLVKTELVIFLKPTIIDDASAPPGSPQLADYYEVPATPAATGPVRYR